MASSAPPGPADLTEPAAGLGPWQIRRAQPADAPALTALMTHPAVQPQLLQLPYASEARWRQLIADIDQPGKTELLLVAEGRDAQGQPVLLGNAGLHPVGAHVRRRHAMNLGIAVLPAAQGQGVGRALMQALLHYADHWGHVLRIELGVFCDNQRAIALYQSHGFEIEGRLRGYALRDGRYDDVFTMARLHPRPPAWPPAVGD